MKAVVVSIALVLAGCSSFPELVAKQKEEIKAVKLYQKAKLDLAIATGLVSKAETNLLYVQSEKAKADIDLKEAKKNMDKVLAK